MPADEQAGASSTPEDINAASDAALGARDYTRYAEIENARERGTPIPEAPAPSPAPSDQTAAPESAAAGTAIQEKKPKGAEERKTELAAEIQDLLRQRAELRAETAKPADKPGEKKTEPPPAQPIAVKPEAKAEGPKKPKLDDFPTFAEFDAANDAYIAELVTFKATEVVTAREAEREAAAANKVKNDAWQTQITEAREDHADFAEVAFSKDTPITPVMDGFIRDSQVGPRILYELGKDASAEGKRIAALGPYEAVRALVAIENGVAPAPKKGPPPVKKLTAAPAPATNLDGRDTENADPVMAALIAGDVPGYIAKANARDRKLAA